LTRSGLNVRIGPKAIPLQRDPAISPKIEGVWGLARRRAKIGDRSPVGQWGLMVNSLAVVDLGHNGCDVKSVVPLVALGRHERIDLHTSRAPEPVALSGPQPRRRRQRDGRDELGTRSI